MFYDILFALKHAQPTAPVISDQLALLSVQLNFLVEWN